MALSISTDACLLGALQWVMAAWHATGKRGLSAGYHLLRRRWKPAYPETTGYTIPTLFQCADLLREPLYEQVATELAEYLLSVQMPYGPIPAISGEPVIFDTGQVIFGWAQAYRRTHDARYLHAGLKAGDWLVEVQSPNGSWKNHQHRELVKVFDTRVAWALLELDRAAGERRYQACARRNLDWALTQQNSNGSFNNIILRRGMLPLTHTLAYTAEGLLESGILLGEERYIRAAQCKADLVLGFLKSDGFLPGEFDLQWRSDASWSCLSGDVQFALVWLRLYDRTRDDKYCRAARSAIAFVKQSQNLDSTNPGIRGGIPGSSPIWGPYERFKYPNWAAKFFLDALLAEKRISAASYTAPSLS